jgi:ribulose kinase
MAAVKKEKKEALLWKSGTSSGHITNLKQSIFESSISMVWGVYFGVQHEG